MKIVITGANGQLGSQLMDTLSAENEVIGLNHHDLELTDYTQTDQMFGDIKPDVILNTAAFHNVPLCEKEPLRAFEVNALAALNLALLSEKMRFRLVHYSTDYVFDGQKVKPYAENDPTNPLNIYGITKRDGETLIQNNCSHFFIVRISGIYGRVPCRAKGGNFITTMIKAARERDIVKVVNDEILTPTSVDAIADNTKHLIERDEYGIYHMTCQGSCSWFDFAGVIFDTLKLSTPLTSCSSEEFPSPVKRPLYSVLENKALQDIELDRMPHWREALINFLSKNYPN